MKAQHLLHFLQITHACPSLLQNWRENQEWRTMKTCSTLKTLQATEGYNQCTPSLRSTRAHRQVVLPVFYDGPTKEYLRWPLCLIQSVSVLKKADQLPFLKKQSINFSSTWWQWKVWGKVNHSTQSFKNTGLFWLSKMLNNIIYSRMISI